MFQVLSVLVNSESSQILKETRYNDGKVIARDTNDINIFFYFDSQYKRGRKYTAKLCNSIY